MGVYSGGMEGVVRMKPKRIQRKRTKGWKMPEGAVYVGRPTKWGNSFSVLEYGQRLAIANYRKRAAGMLGIGVDFSELRGKDLACWCPLDQPCHADVLLEIANAPEATA
jgi:hypothetical protein